LKRYKSQSWRSAAIVLSIIPVCSLFLNLLFGIATFPTEIHILSGKETSVSSVFPFEATFVGDAFAVSGSQDDPVTDNLNISGDEEAGKRIELALLGFRLREVPVRTIDADANIVPAGVTIGVKMYTDGVMVLGTGAVPTADGRSVSPADGVLWSGDLIHAANGQAIENKTELVSVVQRLKEDEPVELSVKRGENVVTASLTPAVSKSGAKTLGIWARDSTQGIGTLTYFNKDTGAFGALGHGILDVDTKRLMSVKTGTIFLSDVVSVKKGASGQPGELIGEARPNAILGEISLNTNLGLYGVITEPSALPGIAYPIAMQNQVREGPAKMLSNVGGGEVRAYDVFIESVNRYSSDEQKGMVVRITDKALLTRTNGIVQGMSGSPLIQDDRLIGAITHVFVQNPKKGYGIFIENMLGQEDRMRN